MGVQDNLQIVKNGLRGDLAKERSMKSLRICSLMLALGTFSICSIPAHAQQEIDPDHFDQSSTVSKHVQSSNRQSHQSARTRQRPPNRKLASVHRNKADHRLRS